MPARRGRGGSEGVYHEGFERESLSGYACDPAFSLPGADRALGDIEAAMDVIRAMPFVDRTRVVIGGHSRASFAAFQAGGGLGTFVEFPKPSSAIGHRIVGFPDMWRAAVEAYLARRGLPATVPSAPPGSGR